MTLCRLRPWHVGTLFAREPGDLLLARLSCSGAVRIGRRGVEADENGQEKSDLFIVAMKLAKKPWVIGRGVGGGKGRVIGVSVHLITFQWSWAGTAM
jgi:hypothetical protein